MSSSITAYTYRPRASSVVGTWFVSGSAVVVCLLMTKFSRDSDRSSRGSSASVTDVPAFTRTFRLGRWWRLRRGREAAFFFFIAGHHEQARRFFFNLIEALLDFDASPFPPLEFPLEHRAPFAIAESSRYAPPAVRARRLSRTALMVLTTVILYARLPRSRPPRDLGWPLILFHSRRAVCRRTHRLL